MVTTVRRTTFVPVAVPSSAASTCTIPVPVRTGLSITPPMPMGDIPVSKWEWLYLIANGIAVLALYTWCVIDIAATVAIRRFEAMIGTNADAAEEDDDMVDELNRMWRGKRDGE